MEIDIRQGALDLAACEKEPIHIPGGVQSSSVVLLFDISSGLLASASANCAQLFDQSAEKLLGAAPERLFMAESAQALRDMMSGTSSVTPRYLGIVGQRHHWAGLFETDGLLGVELNTYEDAPTDTVEFGVSVGEALGEIAEATRKMQRLSGEQIEDFARLVVRRFRSLSGYDRVMLYRFDTDWNGQVIAEACSDRVADSYLGLWFPSSDIPRQARALFLRNRVRPVVDVNAPASPLVPDRNPATGRPIDLSDCSARAVSPVHVEYLKNIDVRATLTIALTTRDKLWGLISCHGVTAPYRLTPGRAAACRLFCESVSTHLSRVIDLEAANAAKTARRRLRQLREEILQSEDLGKVGQFLGRHEADLLEIMKADGLVVVLQSQTFCFGQLPASSTIEEIQRRIARQQKELSSNNFVTNHAAGLWPDLAPALLPHAAGVAAHFAHGDGTKVIAFRKQRSSVISWAGDPYKRVKPTDAGQNLHPRKSFDKWSEETKDRGDPWPHHIDAILHDAAEGLNEFGWLFEWRRSEAELAVARSETAHNALHDALTDMPNRRYLQQRMQEFESERQNPAALLHIDLDGFKKINDNQGHAAGDFVLTAVAKRIQGQVRRNDFYARIGGDEFVVMLAPGTSYEGAAALADRIVSEVSKPVKYQGKSCEVGASVGIALNEGECHSPGVLLHRADLALYEAKGRGRGRVVFFADELEERRRRAEELGGEIQAGIREKQFQPWYQPQFCAETRKIVGVEALMRWNHPKEGVLAPFRFLALAEEMDLVSALDAVAFSNAIEDYRRWLDSGIEIPRISLNVSADRLSDPELVAAIRNLKGPKPELSIELLESIYLDEPEDAAAQNIESLREIGAQIEVDDFGTGRTSIVSLIRLRPDRLKIDRQLVLPIIESEAARRLISSIVEIGQSLGIGITAEGVETLDHAEVLRDLGCTVLQGYALAKPMPSSDLIAFVKERRRRAA